MKRDWFGYDWWTTDEKEQKAQDEKKETTEPIFCLNSVCGRTCFTCPSMIAV